MDYNRSKLGIYEDPYMHKTEELLIFGYSCKLFRDDEKALSLENGEHLIPWMGDANLLIDRFDVRGNMYDLSEAEIKSQPLEECLTPAELKEEEICDQERYLSLYHDETQQQTAYEEESKRLQVELAADGTYKQVGFNYSVATVSSAYEAKDHSVQAPMPEPVSYNPTSDEETFIPPHEMNIPFGLDVPKTVKQNKIILKTAKFIVSQGPQLEIIIKAKQAGNPLFNFLAFDNPLNAYYKHVISLIRHGRYRFENELETPAKSDQSDQYLHPNLSQSVRPDLTPGVAASPTRPSPHCTYSKLITKIREKQKASNIEDTEVPSPILPSSPVQPTAHLQDSKQGPVIGLVDYPSFNQTQDGNSEGEEADPALTKKFPKPVHDYRNIKWPAPELQMVIDKMASYIIKNGSAFEEVVRSREDPRFEFLNNDDEYHPYYKCKIQLYSEVYGDIFKNVSKTHDWKKKKSNEHIKNGGSRTISFSIKSREQEVPLTSHTTFPVESSTSEEEDDLEEEERERRRSERAQRRLLRKQREEKEKKEREEFLRKERQRKDKEEEEKKKKMSVEEESSEDEDLYDIFKYAQEMERDTGSSKSPVESPDEPNSKQEERKKKAAAFISKLKDNKDEKVTVVYGPQIPHSIVAGLLKSASRSPSTSNEEETPPPPPPVEVPQPPPPPPPPSYSPSLPSITDDLMINFPSEKVKQMRETSTTPSRKRKGSTENDASMTSVISGVNEPLAGKFSGRDSEVTELQSRKSRSHKKHTRQKLDSWSPSSSGRKTRKKRKRSSASSHKRRKRRSRSRSRSRGHAKPHRSSHRKKQGKHSSHRDKDKVRKKKHKRYRSPSSVSSLPSSASSSPSTPSTLPSESESEMEIQVIECKESEEDKRSSRGSSIVSLPSVSNQQLEFNPEPKRNNTSIGSLLEAEAKNSLKDECSGSEGENSFPFPSKLPLFAVGETPNSSVGYAEMEKKSIFNPSTSSAMAKIAQGLRAKLNAMLEKEGKLD